MLRIMLMFLLMGCVFGCGGVGQPEEPTNPDPPPGAKFSASSAKSKTGINGK